MEAISRQLSERILATPLPKTIRQAVADAADIFSSEERLAVRSSAIGKDGDISFAGQYTSVLNVAVFNGTRAYQQVIARPVPRAHSPRACIKAWMTGKTPMGVLVPAVGQPQYSGVLSTANPAGDTRESIRISGLVFLLSSFKMPKRLNP